MAGRDTLPAPKIQAIADEVAAVLLLPFEHSVALFVVTSNGGFFSSEIAGALNPQ